MKTFPVIDSIVMHPLNHIACDISNVSIGHFDCIVTFYGLIQ